MKLLLSVISICLVLPSYSQSRVHIDEIYGNEDSTLIYYGDNLFTGIVYDNYPNGQLKFEENLKNGTPDGLQQAWFESGQLQSQTSYKEGKLDGSSQEWYEDGALIYQEYYKDGVQIKPQLPEELQGFGIELDHIAESEFGLQECYAFYGNGAFDLEVEIIIDIIDEMSTIGVPFLFETDDEKVFEFERPGLRGILCLNKNFDRLAIIYTRHPEEL